MEAIYADYSIHNDLIYKIFKLDNNYKVIVYKLSTEDIIDLNMYEGTLDDCIALITIKISK